MNIAMGGQFFENVTIPVLWGTRAVLQDRRGRLSVINLEGSLAHLEILGDEVAPGVRFALKIDAYAVLGADDQEVYLYSAAVKRLSQSSAGLPDLEVRESIRVGSNVFAGNLLSGVGVGIAVSHDRIAVGAPLPAGLASLVVP